VPEIPKKIRGCKRNTAKFPLKLSEKIFTLKKSKTGFGEISLREKIVLRGDLLPRSTCLLVMFSHSKNFDETKPASMAEQCHKFSHLFTCSASFLRENP